jgi:hypothetical protein
MTREWDLAVCRSKVPIRLIFSIVILGYWDALAGLGLQGWILEISPFCRSNGQFPGCFFDWHFWVMTRIAEFAEEACATQTHRSAELTPKPFG